MSEYNEERPNDPLNDLTPWEYLTKHELGETFNSGYNKLGEVYNRLMKMSKVVLHWKG